MEGLAGLFKALGVIAIYHVDKSLRVLKVVLPEAAQLVLTTDVPTVELKVLVLESLDVEADCRDRVDCFVQLHFVEDCGLAGGVEPEHEEAHLLVGAESSEEGSKNVVSHGFSFVVVLDFSELFVSILNSIKLIWLIKDLDYYV